MPVQSVVFDRRFYTVQNAKKKLHELGFLDLKTHITKNTIRFRQTSPNFKRYSTKEISPGILLIFGYN